MAGLSLNIFNHHCDRIYMANIAQTINVLQAMILTDGARMLLTPTYHVFEMYKAHQDATLLPLHLQSDDYQCGDAQIPAISASASRADDGAITLTVCHTAPTQSATIAIEVRGAQASNATGRVLATSELNAHNTFDNSSAVQPRDLGAQELKLDGDKLTLSLPPASVAAIRLEA